MKKLRTIVTMMFFSVIFLGMTSCEVEHHAEYGERRHKEHRDHRPSGAILIIDQNNRDHHSDGDHDH